MADIILQHGSPMAAQASPRDGGGRRLLAYLVAAAPVGMMPHGGRIPNADPGPAANPGSFAAPGLKAIPTLTKSRCEDRAVPSTLCAPKG